MRTRVANADPTVLESAKNTWTPLRLFSLYRLVLAGLFVLLLQLDKGAPPPLGSYDPVLFHSVAHAYLGFALLASLAVSRRWLRFSHQVYLQVLIDVLAITLLMHASGGIGSGLGMLLVVTIAGGSMLTGGRTAGFLAAVASLAVLVEQVYSHLHGLFLTFSYPQAGMLGATLFATAALSHVLAERIRESEALAEQRGVDLANMAQLTEYALQQLDTGVLAVDRHERIRLMNASARRLLRAGHRDPATLEALSPDLARRLRDWLAGEPDNHPIHPAESDTELVPRFHRIGRTESAGILIQLEDASAAAHQAQQLKLASLGRLTASIAHEVRNPLGAISHATELLAESERLGPAEHRLTEIVLKQARRVNTIVENVLQLGRRGKSRPELLALDSWLEDFREEICTLSGLEIDAIALRVESGAEVLFDPGHLQQIVWNLVANGLRHAAETPHPRLSITVASDQRLHLDVRDTGPGIPEALRGRLFEPFFTTENSGTGLGLYIARELAECNRGRLEYVPAPAGACFRLTFADTQQQQVA